VIATPKNPRAVYFQRDFQMQSAQTTFESVSGHSDPDSQM